jgi:hypothetical protein
VGGEVLMCLSPAVDELKWHYLAYLEIRDANAMSLWGTDGIRQCCVLKIYMRVGQSVNA